MNVRRQSGFTMVELMVTIAIVGVVAAIAVPRAMHRSGAGVDTFARRLENELSELRIRATATGRWEQIRLDVDGFDVEEAAAPGLAEPTEWNLVRRIERSSEVETIAYDPRTVIAASGAQPSSGTGLPAEIRFSPDGSAQSATIYIGDAAGQNLIRLVVMRATGATYVLDGW